jgi:hypothetical protein
MFSYTDIANLALGHLGEDDQLRSPDQDSHAARTVKAAWPLVRRICLRELTPSFAKRRDELPALAATPIEWDYQFQLQAGTLRLLEILSPAGARDHYAVEGGRILCHSEGPLKVLVIADVEETALWDDLFVQAFAYRLAYQIADRITSDLSRQDRCWEAYKQAKRQAGGADARQDPPIPHEDSSWVTARWSYGSDPICDVPRGYPVSSS